MSEDVTPKDDELAEFRVSPEIVAQIAAAKAAAKLPVKRKRATGRFVIASFEGVAAASAAFQDRRMLVWLFLVYQARLKDITSVDVTNQALAALGVDRQTKYRALKSLEAAGLISVERRGKRSPHVTLLHAL
jgi:DNA-binding transcriptional ArsR family regulator